MLQERHEEKVKKRKLKNRVTVKRLGKKFKMTILSRLIVKIKKVNNENLQIVYINFIDFNYEKRGRILGLEEVRVKSNNRYLIRMKQKLVSLTNNNYN